MITVMNGSGSDAILEFEPRGKARNDHGFRIYCIRNTGCEEWVNRSSQSLGISGPESLASSQCHASDGRLDRRDRERKQIGRV